MFIGINSSKRRTVLRAALINLRGIVDARTDAGKQDDLEQIDSLLREINAAESLGTKPPTYDAPTHYGDR